MRLIRQLSLAAALVSTGAAVHAVDLSAVPSGSYAVDPTHAYVNFQYTHLGLSRPMLQFDISTRLRRRDVFPPGVLRWPDWY